MTSYTSLTTTTPNHVSLEAAISVFIGSSSKPSVNKQDEDSVFGWLAHEKYALVF